MGKHFFDCDIDDVNEVNEVEEAVEEEKAKSAPKTEAEAEVSKISISALAKVCKSETARLDGRIDETNEELKKLNEFAHGAFQGTSEVDKKITDLTKRVESTEKKTAKQASAEKVSECLAGQKEIMKLLVDTQGKVDEHDDEIKTLITRLDKINEEVKLLSDQPEAVDLSGINAEIEVLRNKVDELATRPLVIAPSDDEIQKMVEVMVNNYLMNMGYVPQPQPQPVPQPQPIQPQPQPAPQPTLFQRANPVDPDPVDIKSFFEYENDDYIIRQEEEQLTLELANTVEPGKKAQHEKATERKSFWVDAAGKPVRELTAKELENLSLIKKK